MLNGHFVEINREPKITNYGNPYRLITTFAHLQENSGPKCNSRIVLLSELGQILYEFEASQCETKWSEYSGEWLTTWRQKDLELEHKPIILQTELVFVLDEVSATKSILLEFKPKYREKKVNDTIEAISSV